ncbi:hypothetical protein VDGL01_01849 [Verticillium dahliae]
MAAWRRGFDRKESCGWWHAGGWKATGSVSGLDTAQGGSPEFEDARAGLLQGAWRTAHCTDDALEMALTNSERKPDPEPAPPILPSWLLAGGRKEEGGAPVQSTSPSRSAPASASASVLCSWLRPFFTDTDTSTSHDKLH